MASPDNYYQNEPESITDKIRFLEERIKAVLEGSELIRKEINRIRNTALTLGQPFPTPVLHMLSHLQMDIVYLGVEVGYSMGSKSADLAHLQDLLQNPMKILSNAGN